MYGQREETGDFLERASSTVAADAAVSCKVSIISLVMLLAWCSIWAWSSCFEERSLVRSARRCIPWPTSQLLSLKQDKCATDLFQSHLPIFQFGRLQARQLLINWSALCQSGWSKVIVKLTIWFCKLEADATAAVIASITVAISDSVFRETSSIDCSWAAAASALVAMTVCIKTSSTRCRFAADLVPPSIALADSYVQSVSE